MSTDIGVVQVTWSGGIFGKLVTFDEEKGLFERPAGGKLPALAVFVFLRLVQRELFSARRDRSRTTPWSPVAKWQARCLLMKRPMLDARNQSLVM